MRKRNTVFFWKTSILQFTGPSIPMILTILALIWSVQSLWPSSAYTAEQHILGWIETVQILPENLSLAAKIDTGADNSSINALNQKEFRKGKEKWIRFSIPLKKNEAIRLERPVLRMTRIKRKGAPSQKRAVVLFDLCVGSIYKQEVPVNLTDRSRFKFPMLIGRSFLKSTALVDSSLTFSQEPSCPLQ